MSAAPAAYARPLLTRLTLVELRKMVDTRAGFWLQIVTAVLMVAVGTLLVIFGEKGDVALDQMLGAVTTPANFLLPVVGILLVTSEWSQRTALITFSIIPQRLNVFAAKLLAGVLLALATMVIGLVMSAIATAAAGGEWHLSPGYFGQIGFQLAAGMAMGIAFGAVIKAPAPAIVIFFVLPTALSALGTLKALDGAAGWLDTDRTLGPLTDHLLSANEWARIGTSLALWLLIPLAVGAWRLLHDDIS
jgi:ABC-2 type transport system permease protein